MSMACVTGMRKMNWISPLVRSGILSTGSGTRVDLIRGACIVRLLGRGRVAIMDIGDQSFGVIHAETQGQNDREHAAE